MTWHIVCLAGPLDRFVPALGNDDATLLVPIGVAGHPDNVSSSVDDLFSTYDLSLDAAARDLMNACVAAYTADIRIPRQSAYDNWTRDLILYLPVECAEGWRAGANTFERLLSFLTGDHWKIIVRGTPKGYAPPIGREPRKTIKLTAKTATLFSGGLDSFIGAVDLLERGEQVVLVGHHSLGGGPTSSSQTRALGALASLYPPERMPLLKLWVSPPKGKKRGSEITTRGRSALFLGLGVAVASCLPDGRLVVSENGLISLNVPLTDARLGSFSTRTTHPHLIRLLRSLLEQLGIAMVVELPYRFTTKGEMLRRCHNRDALLPGLEATMSCAHPAAGRFSGARLPNQHCGYCLPCLIRRASVASAMADPTAYTTSDLSRPLSVQKGADLRAVKMALDRYGQREPQIGDVLLAGPLPGSDNDVAEYLAVYKRGLQELGKFLKP